MELLGNETCATGVVRVHVRADNTLDGLTAQHGSKHLAPQVLGLAIREASVDDVPAVVVFEHVQIDVGERTAHGHRQPMHPRRNLAGRAMCGMRVPWIGQFVHSGSGS